MVAKPSIKTIPDILVEVRGNQSEAARRLRPAETPSSGIHETPKLNSTPSLTAFSWFIKAAEVKHVQRN